MMDMFEAAKAANKTAPEPTDQQNDLELNHWIPLLSEDALEEMFEAAKAATETALGPTNHQSDLEQNH